MVISAGIEPAAFSFGGRRSYPLSYETSIFLKTIYIVRKNENRCNTHRKNTRWCSVVSKSVFSQKLEFEAVRYALGK